MTHYKSVITNTPYRISLGGGGTDLPFYFKKKGGYLLSASIDQYISVNIANRVLDDKVFLQYSEIEWTRDINKLKHHLIKTILTYFGLTKGIQVSAISSMPNFTGLGASSALTVGLVNAILAMQGIRKTKLEIAKLSYFIERELAGEAGGYQDQYISSLGGIQEISIDKKGRVSCKKVDVSSDSLKRLKEGLVLIYTKVERSSSKIIESQELGQHIIDGYDHIKAIGKRSHKLLLDGDIEALGSAMNEHWIVKRQLSKLMTTSHLDKIYIKLKEAGATGGKIIGAGGGGFFLMAVPGKRKNFFDKLKQLKLRNIPLNFDLKGTHVIHRQTAS